MDLVSSVRKEGSRGGLGDFKWSDVKNSAHRENYLGHSVMAPVGRWQANRDLGWYTKGDIDEEEERLRKEREELRRVKDAEEQAMAIALGLPVPPKASENANMVPLGNGDLNQAPKEEGISDTRKDKDHHRSSRRHRHRSRSPWRENRRGRSGDYRDKERRHRRHHHDRERRHSHKPRSRSRGRDDHRRRSDSHSRSRPYHKDEDFQRRWRIERSYSPAQARGHPDRRRDRDDRGYRH